jgi:hypothetical protein
MLENPPASGWPALPPMRDELPTLPCDLREYAVIQTGPESWSADRGPQDEIGFEFDVDSMVAGPLIDVRLDDVPRLLLSAADWMKLGLDHRQGFILALLEQCGDVASLLDMAGLPESETLELLCALCAAGVVVLEPRP